MDAINTRYGKGKVSPLGVFASLWVAPPRKGRLRPGAWREVVAHEAAEALLPPHDEVGRADDGKITNQRNEHEKKHHRQSQW